MPVPPPLPLAEVDACWWMPAAALAECWPAPADAGVLLPGAPEPTALPNALTPANAPAPQSGNLISRLECIVYIIGYKVYKMFIKQMSIGFMVSL